MATYASIKLDTPLWITTALLWVINRVILYPIKVLYSSHYESQEAGVKEKYHNVFLFSLVIVYLLNILWFGMMIKGLYAFVTKGTKPKDTRERE